MKPYLRAVLLAASLALPCAGPAMAQTATHGAGAPAPGAGGAAAGHATAPSGTAMPKVGVPAASVPGAGGRGAQGTGSAAQGQAQGQMAQSQMGQGQKVDINTASAQQLDALPNIGPARARAIIQGRPYRDTAELLNRKIIPRNAYESIKDRVSVR